MPNLTMGRIFYSHRMSRSQEWEHLYERNGSVHPAQPRHTITDGNDFGNPQFVLFQKTFRLHYGPKAVSDSWRYENGYALRGGFGTDVRFDFESGLPSSV